MGAQLAAQRVNGNDSPILGMAAKGAVTVQPRDVERLHFSLDPGHFDGGRVASFLDVNALPSAWGRPASPTGSSVLAPMALWPGPRT